jgi:hypothetical protein
MKIKDLIKELSKFDSDLPVFSKQSVYVGCQCGPDTEYCYCETSKEVEIIVDSIFTEEIYNHKLKKQETTVLF